MRNPRQQCARTARGRILLAALIAAALLGLGAPGAIAASPGEPNDPSFSMQWGDYNHGQPIPTQDAQELLGPEVKGTPGADDRALEAWGVTTGTHSIVIGETDTGIDYNQPDLAANIWSNPASGTGHVTGCTAGQHGYNVLTKTCNPLDEESSEGGNYGGHGTHVAGIMGAVGNNGLGVAGMNWQTTILPVKWLESAATSANNTEHLVTGLKWLVEAKKAGVNVRVINDSPVFKNSGPSPELEEELKVLGQNNILFVTAAGNATEDDDVAERYPCKYAKTLSNVVCVTASNNLGELASWANYGATTVDLAAPGESIYSTLRGTAFGYLSGGSMAAAQVSGAAALILSARPELEAAELKQELMKAVDPLPSSEEKLKVVTGGTLDVAKALPGVVEELTPNSGPPSGGTPVTIKGANLSRVTDVRFGATSASSFKVNSATSITATSPGGTGTVDVTVKTPGGTSATAPNDRFAYVVETGPPTVSAVSPTSGPLAGGTSVTITGTNLGEASAVKFGSNPVTVTKRSSTSVTATSPAGSGTVDVTVTTPGGTSEAGPTDQFSYVSPPTVSAVSPMSGPLAGGTSVTITGTNLGEASAVKFGSNPVTVTKRSSTSVTATSPGGTGTVDITVTTPGGTSATLPADQFSYVGPPNVSAVSPNRGPVAGGTTVTITGESLTGATGVKFGTSNATLFKVNSATSVTATSPAGTGTVDVTVTTPGGTSATVPTDQFSYVAPPAVSTLSPNSGPVAGGTTVTISGANLGEASAVKFGSNPATIAKTSSTSITATSPGGTGNVDVTVTTPGGTSATLLADQFSYVAEIAPTPPGQTQSPGATTAPGPPGAGQSSVLGTTASSSAITLTSSTLTVQRGRAAVRLRCVGSSACRGTLTIGVKLEVHQHGKPTKTRVLTIGRAGLSLSAGQTTSVAVTLTANGRRLLSSAHGRLNALLTILKSATGPSSTHSTHVRLIVRASSAKKSGG